VNRTPPIEVRRQLRAEVEFGCPAPHCGNPYLQWHHFDPPWTVEEHHRPSGMIALCGQHHDQADAGAFTIEQLRTMKTAGAMNGSAVNGRFNWMRNNLLAVVGGNFYYEQPVIFEFQGQPAIWFNRDEHGNFLLNVRMLTVSGEPRLRIEDNFWLSKGRPTDLDCPPSGRILHAKYANDDTLRVEFLEVCSLDELQAIYHDVRAGGWPLQFPTTVVEIHEKVGQTAVEFGPRWTKVGGLLMRNSFFSGNRVGFSLS
jgi:hypothetical protein